MGCFAPLPASLKGINMNAQRHTVSSTSPLCIAASTLGSIFLGLVATATPAFAQNRLPSVNDRFLVESAGCYNGRSSEDGSTCLREANAALVDDRKAKLIEAGLPYRRNAPLRCQAVLAADEAACKKRACGDRWAIGNVESDWSLRELAVQSPVAAK